MFDSGQAGRQTAEFGANWQEKFDRSLMLSQRLGTLQIRTQPPAEQLNFLSLKFSCCSVRSPCVGIIQGAPIFVSDQYRSGSRNFRRLLRRKLTHLLFRGF